MLIFIKLKLKFLNLIFRTNYERYEGVTTKAEETRDQNKSRRKTRQQDRIQPELQKISKI